jgi:hypothetical protein
MKKCNPKDWVDEFISNEYLSDEAIYAVYNFLEQALIRFEMKASCQLRRYRQEQEEIHSNLYTDQETTTPSKR